jgi:hypothetical protein
MPSLERTAYPRFGRIITAFELERVYTPTLEEMAWARATVRTPNHLLCLAVSLKCFQQLHYFPDLELVPEAVVNHVRQCFRLDPAAAVASIGRTRCIATNKSFETGWKSHHTTATPRLAWYSATL